MRAWLLIAVLSTVALAGCIASAEEGQCGRQGCDAPCDDTHPCRKACDDQHRCHAEPERHNASTSDRARETDRAPERDSNHSTDRASDRPTDRAMDRPAMQWQRHHESGELLILPASTDATHDTLRLNVPANHGFAMHLVLNGTQDQGMAILEGAACDCVHRLRIVDAEAGLHLRGLPAGEYELHFVFDVQAFHGSYELGYGVRVPVDSDRATHSPTDRAPQRD